MPRMLIPYKLMVQILISLCLAITLYLEGVIWILVTNPSMHLIWEVLATLLNEMEEGTPTIWISWRWFPFSGIEERLLRRMSIKPFQLYPYAWAFAKVFQYWCEYCSKELSFSFFFYLFFVSSTSKDPHLRGMHSFCQAPKMFDIYIDN